MANEQLHTISSAIDIGIELATPPAKRGKAPEQSPRKVQECHTECQSTLTDCCLDCEQEESCLDQCKQKSDVCALKCESIEAPKTPTEDAESKDKSLPDKNAEKPPAKDDSAKAPPAPVKEPSKTPGAP